jgi:isoleucyl-tRNA synthetase
MLDDRISLEIFAGGALRGAAEAHREMIQDETLASKFTLIDAPKGKHTEEYDIDGDILKIGVTALPRG